LQGIFISLFATIMSFAQRLAFGIILALLVGAGTVYFIWQRIDEIQHSIRHDDRTERMQAESDRLLAQFIGMETGVRSYIITGDSTYLTLYARTVGELPLTVKELRAQMQPLTPETASILNFLDVALDKKIVESNQAIAMRRDQGIKIAAFVLIKGKMANAADTITNLIQKLQRTARTANIKQYETVPKQYHETAYLLLYGLGGAMTIFIAAALWALFAHWQALKPIVEGVEKLSLGDFYHRIPSGKTADVKPVIAAVNTLGERMLSMQGKTRQSEDVYADVFHATPDCVSVWRASRNGYGQISDFECILANNAWNMAYHRSVEYFTGKRMNSALPDFQPLFEQCKMIVEQHQKLTLPHIVEGKHYRLIASKMRDGLLLRLME
jgi:CHASE3 domain sensor protein